MMTVYFLDKDKSQTPFTMVRLIAIIGLINIIIVLLVMLIYFVNSNNFSAILVSSVGLLCMPFASYLLNKQFLKLEESWASSEIELGDDFIELRKKHKPEISIEQEEITMISSRKGITIQTSNRFRKIAIPENLIGLDEVRSKLSTWVSFQPHPKERLLLNIAPLLITSIAIILGAILAIVTRSIWPVILIILTFLSRIIYFALINRQRIDLTNSAKRSRFISYSFNFLIFIYLLVVVIQKIIG